MCRGDYWVDNCFICGCRLQTGDPHVEFEEAKFLHIKEKPKDKFGTPFCAKCADEYKKRNI